MARLVIVGVRNQIILSSAVLHDVVEDTPYTIEDIAEKFGQDIAGIVGELTLPPGISREEKHEHQLSLMRNGSDRAMMIKLADRASNLRSVLDTNPWGRKAALGYAKKSLELVEACPKKGCRKINTLSMVAIETAEELIESLNA